MSNCLRYHQQCGRSDHRALYNFYPTRLLDLQPQHTDVELCLCITHQNPPETPYMTLSHCWGTARFFKLTSTTSNTLRRASNSESFLEVFGRLSKLQGSLTFAIDGWMLYAFFDSTEDCRYESATMMDVYQNTHCNIAAADASYSEQGCFFYRDLSLIPPITVETRWNNFAHNGSYHVHPSTFWKLHLEKSPLN